MKGCRAWYAIPMMWLAIFAAIFVYEVHRGPEWEGWFGWLAPDGDPDSGDLIAVGLVLLATLVAHCGLRGHINREHAFPRPYAEQAGA